MKNNNSGLLKRLVIMTFCALLLSGCVTETNSPRSEQNVDKAKALELHTQLANNYIQKGNRESARHHLRKAFDIDRNSPAATAAMARLYLLEGEAKLAEEHFQRALRRDKKLTWARNDYGLFLYRAGRYEEALEQFETAGADLDYDERARVLVNLGRTAVKLGKTERAETVFQHASLLDRQLASPLIELADLAFQRQDYSNAKIYLERYTTLTRPTARSLLLGIRIERTFDNKDKEASYVMALKNLFPYSKEYLQYKQYLAD